MTWFLAILTAFMFGVVVSLLRELREKRDTISNLEIQNANDAAAWDKGMTDQEEAYEQQFLSHIEDIAVLRMTNENLEMENGKLKEKLTFHNENCLLPLGEYPVSDG